MSLTLSSSSRYPRCSGRRFFGTASSTAISVARPTRPRRSSLLDSFFVPTPQDVVEKMLELANVRARGLVYDLGCGDGRIVVTAAKKYGCKAVGYEIDADLVELRGAT